MRLPVDNQDGACDVDAGEIVELIVLSKLPFRRLLGSALNDRDSVTDTRHETRPPRGKFLGRKRSREDTRGLGRLCAGQGRKHETNGCKSHQGGGGGGSSLPYFSRRRAISRLAIVAPSKTKKMPTKKNAMNG